ncbi:hypothetical protein DICVIV_07028 [Dictyocaulus viviparus]|uniref:Globin family profile domain-containing protein n=1 Tax=Dictyocaulus viviparus TaxID=29172 RepID=A0A0D8XSW8_DICVI|nr:hypothetical protein DICVIV_07028 [Dictyocaulus viviparus]
MKHIGSSHAVLSRTCGFTSDIWERFGEIAMERICSHEIVQKTREAARAWRILLACVIDELRGGFDCEARYHRKTSSAEHLENADSDAKNAIQDKMRQLRIDYDSTVPYR